MPNLSRLEWTDELIADAGGELVPTVPAHGRVGRTGLGRLASASSCFLRDWEMPRRAISSRGPRGHLHGELEGVAFERSAEDGA